jgi:hypothetical protein
MKPTYEQLVEALRKAKSNGTRLRYDTRSLIENLLAEIDSSDPDEAPELGKEWFAKARLVKPGEKL